MADRVGDQVVVVQDQEQRQSRRAQLVQQSRQDRPVQVRAWAPQGRQRAPPYARLDGAERLHHIGPEPCGVVVALVQRDPGHPASARDRAPLGQQRRLAEAGRSVHQAELALQAELEQRLEAGPRYQPGPSGRRPQLGPHQLGTRRTHRLRRAMVRPVHADGHGGGAGSGLQLPVAVACGGVLWWQVQDAPDDLCRQPLLAHAPGRGDPVHDRQAPPAVGPLLRRLYRPQVRILILDRHVHLGAAQLHPQLQRRASVDRGVGDQLTSHQPGRLGHLLQSPAATHLTHEQPTVVGCRGHRPQREPLLQPRGSGARIGQCLVQAGVHRQAARRPLPQEGVGHHRTGAAQHQGSARPAEGGMADGGEHPGTQRVDRLQLAQVADDRRWVLGQLLEDGALELGDGGQVEPAGQGQHRAALVAGLLDPHRGPLPTHFRATTLQGKHPTLAVALSKDIDPGGDPDPPRTPGRRRRALARRPRRADGGGQETMASLRSATFQAPGRWLSGRAS